MILKVELNSGKKYHLGLCILLNISFSYTVECFIPLRENWLNVCTFAVKFFIFIIYYRVDFRAVHKEIEIWKMDQIWRYP